MYFFFSAAKQMQDGTSIRTGRNRKSGLSLDKGVIATPMSRGESAFSKKCVCSEDDLERHPPAGQGLPLMGWTSRFWCALDTAG
jgi:hypothetical protein